MSRRINREPGFNLRVRIDTRKALVVAIHNGLGLGEIGVAEITTPANTAGTETNNAATTAAASSDLLIPSSLDSVFGAPQSGSTLHTHKDRPTRSR